MKHFKRKVIFFTVMLALASVTVYAEENTTEEASEDYEKIDDGEWIDDRDNDDDYKIPDESTDVAELNGISYSSLEDALNSANGETVTLTSDVYTTEQIVVTGNAVLDADEWTVTSDTAIRGANGGSSMILIDGGILEITGEWGLFEAGEETSYIFEIINDGTLVLDDGFYTGTDSIAIIKKGRLRINDGEYYLSFTDGDRPLFIIEAENDGDAVLEFFGGAFYNWDCSDETVANYAAEGYEFVKTDEDAYEIFEKGLIQNDDDIMLYSRLWQDDDEDYDDSYYNSLPWGDDVILDEEDLEDADLEWSDSIEIDAEEIANSDIVEVYNSDDDDEWNYGEPFDDEEIIIDDYDDYDEYVVDDDDEFKMDEGEDDEEEKPAEGSDIAELNGVSYSSLEEALNAANGETVTLTSDVYTTEQIVVTGNAMLDTDKWSVVSDTAIKGANGGSSMILIDGGSLEITGEWGGFDAGEGTGYIFEIINDGTLVLDNGYYLAPEAVAIVKKGTLRINDGEFDHIFTSDEDPLFIAESGNDGDTVIELYGGMYIGWDCKDETGKSLVAEGYEVIQTSEDTYEIFMEENEELNESEENNK